MLHVFPSTSFESHKIINFESQRQTALAEKLLFILYLIFYFPGSLESQVSS
jgi:hypothetical protein